MAVTFIVQYHSDVVHKDIPALSATSKLRIRIAIEEKLTIAPETFGKPLRQSLRGYRKLRVGDYRVVFSIDGTRVRILAILHRSVVYSKVAGRSKSK